MFHGGQAGRDHGAEVRRSTGVLARQRVEVGDRIAWVGLGVRADLDPAGVVAGLDDQHGRV
jgi:hypothetical protein